VRTEDLNESWPEIPDWVDRRELGRDVLGDLRSLSKQGAEFVADHLVAAGALADEEPEVAWRHARAARSQGGRVAVVRETVGLVAYRAGEWAEAISELRAARRMGGGPGHLPVMADAERALGHPERAIELSRSVEATALDAAGAAELTIVVAGARSDLGQDEVALVGLRAAAEGVDGDAPYAARIYYAYADLLDRTGRRDDAITWFVRAADADADEETDAAERLDELTSSDSGTDVADDEHSDVDGSDEEVDDSALAEDDDSDPAGSDDDDDSDPAGSDDDDEAVVAEYSDADEDRLEDHATLTGDDEDSDDEDEDDDDADVADDDSDDSRADDSEDDRDGHEDGATGEPLSDR
jgi:tetratricopeptide (TPR) repeat protein